MKNYPFKVSKEMQLVKRTVDIFKSQGSLFNQATGKLLIPRLTGS